MPNLSKIERAVWPEIARVEPQKLSGIILYLHSACLRKLLTLQAPALRRPTIVPAWVWAQLKLTYNKTGGFAAGLGNTSSLYLTTIFFLSCFLFFFFFFLFFFFLLFFFFSLFLFVSLLLLIFALISYFSLSYF